jgi:hypothetical protein
LRAPLDDVKKPLTEIRDEMTGFAPKGHEWKGPKPVSGPTPEDAMRDLEEMNRLTDEAGAEPDKAELEPDNAEPELDNPETGNEPKA